MKRSYLIVLFLIIAQTLQAQSYVYLFSFGNFSEAASFYINPSGYIYVSDSRTNEIYKLDTLGNVLRTNGGFGWEDGSFDNPADIFATDLSVYVADKNNHRIQRFDKDLNFISKLSSKSNTGQEDLFGYPNGISVSNQGDLFILDSENIRVLKFDLFGKLLLNFGGYDAGSFYLTAPRKIGVSANNTIYVLDRNSIVLYDFFGAGLGTIPLDNNTISLKIIFHELTINDRENVWAANLREGPETLSRLELSGLEDKTEFRSSLVFNDKLYILTAEKILVFGHAK